MKENKPVKYSIALFQGAGLMAFLILVMKLEGLALYATFIVILISLTVFEVLWLYPRIFEDYNGR